MVVALATRSRTSSFQFKNVALTRRVNDKLAATVQRARNGHCLLTLTMASGRRLYFRNARLMKDAEGRDSVVYDGVHPAQEDLGADPHLGFEIGWKTLSRGLPGTA